MRRVLLSENAANEVMRIREDKFGAFSDEKCNIADAFGHLTTMLNLGRDCEEMANCIDGILNVMAVLDRYNDLLNSLNETDDKRYGRYELVEPEQDYDKDRDSAVCGAGCELLKRVFAKHPEVEKIYAPANVDAITLKEAADVLGCSVDELTNELEEERREKYEQNKL